MPDLQEFSVAPNGTATLNNFPRFTISAKITDSKTGAVLFDFTGANAIQFPGDLPTILNTAAERRAFVETIAHFLLHRKAAG